MLVYAYMPRIASEPLPEVIFARAQLRDYLARPETSQTTLSILSGVPQYTISKFLSGRIKSLTPQVVKFLKYANNGIKNDITRLSNDPRIQRALGEAWDGTDAGLILLARTIDAIGPVIRASQPKT